MVSISTEQLQQVLASVDDWPTSDRILLARKILETVERVPLPDSPWSIGETPRSGFLRTAGALADDDQWDAIMEEICRSRGATMTSSLNNRSSFRHHLALKEQAA